MLDYLNKVRVRVFHPMCLLSMLVRQVSTSLRLQCLQDQRETTSTDHQVPRLALRGREVGYTQMVWAKVGMAKDLAVVHLVVMDRMVVDLPADLLADLVGKVVAEMATDHPMVMETIRLVISTSTEYHQIWIQYHMTTAIMNNSKDRGDSGYRALKPKAQMSSVKSDNAFDLMMQIMQFETDLGEVGVQLNSEGAYRQLKAQCVVLAWQETHWIMLWYKVKERTSWNNWIGPEATVYPSM